MGLYVLLRLEGRPTEWTTLVARLPTPSSQGYSMLELRGASRACGLDLTGVHLHPGEQPLDRAMMAYMMRGRHGHFLVVRPVGHSGKLAQVIDTGRVPEVMDAADLFASPEWTGLALIPDRPNWPARIAVALLVILSLLAALRRAIPRFRGRRALTAPAVEVPNPSVSAR